MENAFYRHLIDSSMEDSIKFWRTLQGNEIDFVLNSREAYEVKADIHQFKKSKYSVFGQMYPDIPVAIVALDKKCDRVDDTTV